MATLRVIFDPNAPRDFPLLRRETMIGRQSNCDVVIPDSTISRVHARILCEKDGFYLEDLRSSHGTRLNGRQISKREPIEHMDEIQISGVSLQFLATDPSPEHTAEPLTTTGDIGSAILSRRDASSLINKSNVNPEQKLKALLEINQILGATLDVEQIFPVLLDRAFQVFPQASRGCVLLADSVEGDLVPQAVKYRSESEESRRVVSRTIAECVIGNGEAILCADTNQDSRFMASDSVATLQIRSVMCAPLLAADSNPLGMIQLESGENRLPFVEEDLDVLVNVAKLAGQIVSHAKLHQTRLQYDRRERDLSVAQQVQLHFLPQKPPELDGYQIRDFYHAAESVGGDYFGYITLPDGRMAIAMGDVSGKGVSAALLMARLCSDVRYCLATQSDLSAAVGLLDKEMEGSVLLGGFITFVLCVLDTATGELAVVNAGHMPPLCRRAATGVVEQIGDEVAHLPLGVGTDAPFQEAKTVLDPGDCVLLYTDGVSEATNVNMELFGAERIAELLGKSHDSESTLKLVCDELKRFTGKAPRKDDTCMVAFSRMSES